MLFLFAWLTDVAIDASHVSFVIDLLIEWLKFLLTCADALRVVALVLAMDIAFASEDVFFDRILFGDIRGTWKTPLSIMHQVLMESF